MESEAWIRELLQSLIKGHSLMDPSAWAPPNPFLLDPLFTDLWFEKILKFKKLATERDINFRQIADAAMGPACVRKEFRYALWGGKLRGLSAQEILQIITFYHDILLTRSPQDPFCLHNAFWHSEEEVLSILGQTQWVAAGPDTKRMVGRISANSPPLAWGLLTDFFYHRVYELYGLYHLPDREILMIRQYGPFRAEEIWPHTKNYSFSQIIIKCIYDNLQGDFDYINHFTTPDNIPQKLKFFSVSVDGQEVNDLAELERLNAEVIQMAVAQDKHLRALDEEGQKRLAVLAKHYAWKEMFQLAGIPWYPDVEVFDRFVKKPLLEIKFSKLESHEQREAFWRGLFDPARGFTAPEFADAKQRLASDVL